jgi:Clp amino terminal domain, pathogenicity island component
VRIRSDTFTDGARTIMFHSGAHALRLGHGHRGGEHFLLALAAADLPVAAVLREHGVTAERVEEEIVRLEGLGPGAALFAGLDPDALAAIGVDLGTVRDRVEASFGPDALARAGQATHQRPHRSAGVPRGNPRPIRPGLVARWRRRRRARHTVLAPPVPPAPPGRYRATGLRPAGQIPPTPDAWLSVHRSVHEAMIRHDSRIGAEHLALAFTAMNSGLVPRILADLGTSAPELRAAILRHHEEAS